MESRRASVFLLNKLDLPSMLLPKLEPPLGASQFTGREDVWRLCANYLEYIVPFQNRRWHPISEHIYGVIEASKGSLDAKALNLGVAVEGVAMFAFEHLACASASLKAEFPDLLKHVSSWEGFRRDDSEASSLLRRVNGLLGALLRPSVNEIFKILLAQGSISKDEVVAWKQLRHPRAHGKLSDSAELEGSLWAAGKVTVLLYKLIFTAVGYSGPYIDYGAKGWPTRQHS